MCIETMDIPSSKHTKTDCLRKNLSPSSKLTWRQLRVTREDDEALRRCRPSAVKATVHRLPRQAQKRAQLAKLANALGEISKKKRKQPEYEEGLAVACVHRHPSGAMAPENTTQYLMGNVYEDLSSAPDKGFPAAAASSQGASAHLYGESLSPRRVYAALDSDFESCFAFQQRDFEEVYGLCS